MPRRWIDPDLFTDEKLAKATLAERYLFAAMIANQDDDGRLLGHPGYLRSIAFPYDDYTKEEVKEMRDHLAEVNPNVIVYNNSGNEYIQLRRHARYQQPRYYHKSKFPAPPGWPFEVEPPKNDDKGDVEKTIRYEIANKLRSGQWQPTNEEIKYVELNKRLANLYADIFATTVSQTYILIEVKQYPLQFRDLGQVLDYRKEAESRGLTPIKTYLIGKGMGNLSLEEALSSSVTPLNLDLTEIKFVTPTNEDVSVTTGKDVDVTRYTEDRVGVGLGGVGSDLDLDKGKTKRIPTVSAAQTAKTPDGARKKRADPVVNEIFSEMRRFLEYPEGKVCGGEALPAIEENQAMTADRRDPIPNYGKEGKAIKRMLTRGFTREEILACWRSKVSQRGGEFVSMVWVNEDIGNFVRGGEPLPTVKPERNKAVKPEKEGGHYGAGYRPPKPEGASKPGRTIDAEREAGATG